MLHILSYLSQLIECVAPWGIPYIMIQLESIVAVLIAVVSLRRAQECIDCVVLFLPHRIRRTQLITPRLPDPEWSARRCWRKLSPKSDALGNFGVKFSCGTGSLQKLH